MHSYLRHFTMLCILAMMAMAPVAVTLVSNWNVAIDPLQSALIASMQTSDVANRQLSVHRSHFEALRGDPWFLIMISAV